ncbi:MAG: hypothetical protein K5880_14790 [Hydrogenophaga sp.]|uniref:hypothetical protein n=1 Tax=Hydrogenophaga sp. TaxID=1904254 RepID=UPI002633EBF3|nr:hypothetical protein [Hydrogenophaga sp.]MCV0439864.1 hypothetical protein [Hydrogenophaga sp.]
MARRLSSAGILTFKEKHGDRYFVCNTPEDYCKAAMKILKERASEKFCWYYDDPKDPDTGLTRAKEIIETNDLEAAFEFLDLRSDWEYEGMDIEYPETY